MIQVKDSEIFQQNTSKQQSQQKRDGKKKRFWNQFLSLYLNPTEKVPS